MDQPLEELRVIMTLKFVLPQDVPRLGNMHKSPGYPIPVHLKPSEWRLLNLEKKCIGPSGGV